MDIENRIAQELPTTLQSTETPSAKWPEGIMIAIASAATYVFAYRYESAFASVFNIPTQFISVSLMTLLSFGAAIIGILVALLFGADLTLILILQNKHPVLQRVIRPVAIVFLLTMIHIALVGWRQWSVWWPSALVLLGVLILQFVLPIVTQTKISGGYIAKLEAQENADRRIVNVASYIGRTFGYKGQLVVATFFYGLYLSFNIGFAEARNQRQFLVTNTVPEMAVLRVYGENLISAPFDRSTKQIESRFVVLKVAETPGLVLALEEIGPLHSIPPATVISQTTTIVSSTTQITQTITVVSPTVSPLPAPTSVRTP